MLTLEKENNYYINNENNNLCSKCGGRCCKTMGCHFSPRDFDNITLESLQEMINKGYISIDWWEGDIYDNDRWQVYFLRIRNENARIIDPSWGGKCMLLTEHGCSLSFDERPMGGKALIPVSIGECKTEYTKEDCCREWYPYQDILEELVDIYS